MREDADLYRVLGVRRGATADEIRRAYRRLARQHHPDLTSEPDGPQQFAAVSRAYEILRDPVQRARYDHVVAPPPTPRLRDRPRRRPQAVPITDQIPRRGVLELSPSEAAHLARFSMVLRDPYGQTIRLPAGTRDGDQVTIVYDGQPASLTIRCARDHLTHPD